MHTRAILGASRPQFRRMRGIRMGADEVLFGSGDLTVLKWQVGRRSRGMIRGQRVYEVAGTGVE